ncbi:MAG: bifunctional proline dehydrogenase/L-glutamate gamma-semialdehyde dehydrogenase, partial [Planctomycetota bacterium]
MTKSVDGIDEVRRLLADARAGRFEASALPTIAAEIAEALLRATRQRQTWRERADQRRIAGMMNDPAGKAFTVEVADRVLRAPTREQAAVELGRLVRRRGAPVYMGGLAGLAVRVAAAAAPHMPNLVVGGIESVIRELSSRVILDGNPEKIHRHIAARRAANVHINLNQLGEAVLGEGEAARRLERVRSRIADPAVDYVSVKLSSVFSQASALAHARTVDHFAERLRILLRDAVTRPGNPVFINLDMEEYRDLRPTMDAFMRVLDEDGYRAIPAGMVLQAYLPDAHAALQELITWAQRRRASGGAWIRLRLVKGANLAMERVDAEVHGWPLATYPSKPHVDASFKRILDAAIRSEHADAVRIGVGSHNLFDIAYALLLREQRRVSDMVTIEMLEGMAEGQALALAALGESPRLYAPVVDRREFTAALAYLVRRLDENTHPENYLRHAFALEPGSAAWSEQRERFLTACRDAATVPTASYRRQDRNVPLSTHDPSAAFQNVPDTDWTSAANRAWISPYMVPQQRPVVRLCLAGEERDGVAQVDGQFPWRVAGGTDVADALACAVAAVPGWHARGLAARSALLMNVADVFERRRGDLIGIMVAEGRKTVAEADVEVSETVDFSRYYAHALAVTQQCDGLESTPIGPVVIAPPWNFPCAIPASGILAALIAGNTAIIVE